MIYHLYPKRIILYQIIPISLYVFFEIAPLPQNLERNRL